MTKRKTRPRCFASWNPRPETVALLEPVGGMLAREAQARALLLDRLGVAA